MAKSHTQLSCRAPRTSLFPIHWSGASAVIPLLIALASATVVHADTYQVTFDGHITETDAPVPGVPDSEIIENGDPWTVTVTFDADAQPGLGGGFPMLTGIVTLPAVELVADKTIDFIVVANDIATGDVYAAAITDDKWEADRKSVV